MDPDSAFMTAVVQRYSTTLSQAQHQLIVGEVQQETLRRERDEARAEVEQLRAELEQIQGSGGSDERTSATT